MKEFEVKERINYALLVDPEETYPVSYVIKQNGEKQLCPASLLGKDLTENQIKELVERKIVHVGFVPLNAYTAQQKELAEARDELKDCEFTLNLAVKSEWVSVDDRLPEPNKSVLVIYSEIDIAVIAFYGGLTNSWMLDSSIGIVTEFKNSEFRIEKQNLITHWMPLPNPPKQ